MTSCPRLPMIKPIVVQKFSNQPQVLIVGNHDQLGFVTVKEFLQNSLEVVFFPFDTSAAFDNDGFFNNPHLQLLNKFDKQISAQYLVFIDSQHSESTDALKKSLELAYTNKSRFVLVSQIPPNDSPLFKQFQLHHHLLEENLCSGKVNIRLIHLNHLYGPGVYSQSHNSLAPIFNPILQHQFCVSGSSENICRPLYIQDAVRGVLLSLFTSNSLGKIYELGGNKISLINLTLLIRQHCQNQSFTVSNNNIYIARLSQDLESQINLTQKELGEYATTKLESGIIETISSHLSSTTIHLQPNTTPSRQALPTPTHNLSKPIGETSQVPSGSSPRLFSLTKKSHSKNPNPPTGVVHPSPVSLKVKYDTKPPLSKAKKALLKIATLIIISLVLLIFWVFINYYQVKSGLSRLTRDFTTSNTSSIKTSTLQNQTKSLENKVKLFSPIISMFGHHPNISPLFSLIEISKLATQTITNITQAHNTSTQTLGYILGRESGNIPKALADTNSLLLRSYHNISELDARLHADLPLADSLNSESKLPTPSLYTATSLLKPQLFTAHKLVSQLPTLLGFDRKKTFLILIQNNHELRPTGGFVSAFTLVTFDKGQLLDVKTQSVYSADNQLKGHVEPPPPIKQYLGENNWYLRDVNWDPDFPTTAKRAGWFVDKEINQPVDGVVSLDLYAIKTLLEYVGPIHIDQYNETIDHLNFLERVQYQVETTPNNTHSDYLGNITDSLFQQIVALDTKTLLSVTKPTLELINQKHIMFFPFDTNTQSSLTELNWSGELKSFDCQQFVKSKACVSDYLAIIEANVGVNKSNYFISRKIEQHTQITTQGSVIREVTITHHNTSPSDNWPGGPYRNYLRLYLPPNTTLRSVKINSQVIPTKDISISQEHGKSTIGFLIVTNPNSTTTTDISYQLESKLAPTSPVAYSLLFQKQPGTNNDPVKFTLNFPTTYQLVTSKPAAQSKPGSLELNTNQLSDLIYSFEFAH